MPRLFYRPFLAILLLVGLPAGAWADVWLQGSRISLTLSSGFNWMPSWASYEGTTFQNGFAANSSVLNLADVGWAGAVHLRETLLDAQLEVDGLVRGFDEGPILEGEAFHLSRLLSLDGAYQVAHELDLTGGEIQERFSFTGLDAAREVEIFYPAMSSRANSFTQWITFDAIGNPLTEGVANADDESFTMFPWSASAVAMFDPVAGIGAVTRWWADAELLPRPFLWDRGATPIIDNKLYLRLHGADGPADQQFEVFQRTTLFESSAADWRQAATAWAAPTPGDANQDGRVDLDDFGVLKGNFGGVGLSIPGDLDHSGAVDLSDFGLLKQNFGRQPWPATAAQAVPEPSAVLLALLASSGLTLVWALRARFAVSGPA